MDDHPDNDSATETPTTLRTSSPTRHRSNYIPRAPNAFILFRSSFIRSQRISGSVEGNHSRLSQIIGSYWNALPQQEKEQWEAKAAVALEEHKRRYPDWRFVNAQSRRGGRGSTETRGKRGRGRGKKRKVEGERVELIRDLLVEGIEGEALEKAVEEWDKNKKKEKKSQSTSSSAQDPYATISPQASPYQQSPYQSPGPSSSTSPTSAPPSYPVSSFSSLSGWAGEYSQEFPSPTSATFPSPSFSPSSYSAFNSYSFYEESKPSSYEDPMPYDNPYAYPAYSHALPDNDPPSTEPEYLPYEPVLESSRVTALPPRSTYTEPAAQIPETQGQQYAWQAWEPPTPSTGSRKGKQRAPPPQPVDTYGWGIPPPEDSQHPHHR